MTKLFAFLTYLFANIFDVSLHPSRPRLPQCMSTTGPNNDIDLNCIVVAGQFLDYNEVRAFTQAKTDQHKFNVSITCNKGGVVHLPWPFSAQNVISLQVSGCETVGFISEMFDLYPHANELKYISIVDVKNKVTVKELYDAFFKHDFIPQEYECGMSNVIVQIFRNMEYTFPTPSGSIDELIMLEELMSSNSLDKLIANNAKCVFPYMTYMEESGNSAFSLVRFKIMESASQYPVLQVYDLSNNSMGAVPSELRNLDIKFLPKLASLDLSDNVITDANFFYKEHMPKSLHVDLKRNRVRSFGRKLVADLVKSENIILDLRENPLVCSCELFTYANHLSSLRGNSVAQEISLGMTCEHQNRGTLETHRVTEIGLGKQLCSQGTKV